MCRSRVSSFCTAPQWFWLTFVVLIGGALVQGRVEEVVVTREQVEDDWLQQYELLGSAAGSTFNSQAVDGVLQRARCLADALRTEGVDVEPFCGRLRTVERELDLHSDQLTPQRARELYLRARWIARDLAGANPALGFDSLIFVQRAPGSYPHMSDQYCGWFSRPGGGLYILEGWKRSPQKRRLLTGDLPVGSVLRPDLSYDGRRVLFAYCRHVPGLDAAANKLNKESIPEDAFYHLYEIQIDGSGLRRLTFGKHDHFDGRYLPNGQIVFVSTRRGQSIQCLPESAPGTAPSTWPDSYMRCGGGLDRPVPVCTLHVMDADGKNLRCLSPSEGFEWNPTVAADGRILYSRWDYVDRDSLPFVSLWSTMPDGSAPQAVFGNSTANPIAMLEPRQIPGSQDLVFTAAAQHAITGGSLVQLDPRLGKDAPVAMRRLTPQVPWPESEAWPNSYFTAAFPLSPQFYLVAWSNRRLISEFECDATVRRGGRTTSPSTQPSPCPLPEGEGAPEAAILPPPLNNPQNALGLYVLDAFGNLELIYRDAALSSTDAIPLRSRKRPPQVAAIAGGAAAREGRFLLLDVDRGLEGVTPGMIRSLRIVGVLPKTQPTMNFPPLGLTEEDAGKFVLGTVPVAADGSAYFRLPAGVPVFFQALDDRGMAIQTMRSVTYVQAGRTYSCLGCHEHRGTAPVNQMATAVSQVPVRITPGPVGTWPFDFEKLVQPVLDRQCVHCHKPGTQGGEFDLAPGNAYSSLIAFGARGTLQSSVLKRYNAGSSLPDTEGARNSSLARFLRRRHYDVELSADDWERLITWMDLYAQQLGSFSSEQEQQLRDLRKQWAPLLTRANAD